MFLDGGDSIPKKTFINLDKEKQNRIIECAFDEFATTDFSHAKLSNIIKNAKIPRGSLYQYFEDKTDLYLYLIDLTAKEKMEYMKDDFNNPMDLPFLDLFKKMYISGIQFAANNPKMVSMFSHLLANKGEIFDKVMKNNFDVALDIYCKMIDRDKSLGRIRKSIDTKVLAQLVIDMTINVSVNEMSDSKESFDFDKMYQKIEQIVNIIEHGVTEEK
ncbi:MAG: TetR/AcrR family transcriptional regulator [Tenericutes bacterium]|nr:TetR/AcrR family transcriptional regulator [Mycoplasmatota bacterium]